MASRLKLEGPGDQQVGAVVVEVHGEGVARRVQGVFGTRSCLNSSPSRKE